MWTIDYSFCTSPFIGERGISGADSDEFSKEISKAFSEFREELKKTPYGFVEIAIDPIWVKRSLELATKLSFTNLENVLVLGIGGSALGMRAMAQALLHPFHNLLARSARKGFPRIFVADNIDPDWFEGMLDVIEPEGSVFLVISKSGGTAETMSQFLILRNRLISRLGEEGYRKRAVTITDRESGLLRKITEKDGLLSIEVPRKVGGRYSVLSPVGLVPAALVGIDINALWNGANKMYELCLEEQWDRNPATLLSSIFCFFARKRRNILVMMPYSSRLLDTAEWFQQLWAESLGKKFSLDGKIVNAGTTPVRALGATDQHSQLQLYLEGPEDKLIVFLKVKNAKRKGEIPQEFPELEGVSYLGGLNLKELLDAEQFATSVALAENFRPNLTLELEELDAFHLGGIFYLLELVTVLSGKLFNVNPFDQPAVELGKLYSFALLKRKGYEENAKKIEKFFEGKQRFIWEPGLRF